MLLLLRLGPLSGGHPGHGQGWAGQAGAQGLPPPWCLASVMSVTPSEARSWSGWGPLGISFVCVGITALQSRRALETECVPRPGELLEGGFWPGGGPQAVCVASGPGPCLGRGRSGWHHIRVTWGASKTSDACLTPSF